MGAAVAGRDRVAVGADEAVAGVPGYRPLAGAVAARLVGLAGKDRRDGLLLAELGREVFAEAAGKMERRLLGDLGALHDLGVSRPADLDAAKEVGLGAG